MSGFDIHFQALESCRTAARKAWGQYETLHGGLARTTPTAADLFGHVTGAEALGTAVDGVYKALTAEIEDARTKVKSVEGALEKVQDNVRAAHGATSTSMQV